MPSARSRSQCHGNVGGSVAAHDRLSAPNPPMPLFMIMAWLPQKALRFVGVKGKNRTFKQYTPTGVSSRKVRNDGTSGKVEGAKNVEGVVIGILMIGFIGWLFDDLVLDCTIESAIKMILSPVCEWISNLFEHSEPQSKDAEPFVVSEYLARIEKAHLEILERQKPVEQIIILWWGLDGLRLNGNGTSEWISRKKSAPVPQNVFYQPAQTIAPMPQYDMCQDTQATREQIMALKMQLNMVNFNSALQAQMRAINAATQSYIMSSPAYYSQTAGWWNQR